MVPIPREAFERRCRALDAAGLAAFAADLYAARGYDARREGDVLVLGSGPDARRLRATTRGRGDGDVVAAVDPDAAVDAVALRRMLLYAVDRETGRTICRRHLDVDLTGYEPAEGGAREQSTVPTRPVLAAVGAVAVVLAVALGAGSHHPFLDGSGTGPDAAGGAAVPAGTTVATSARTTPLGGGTETTQPTPEVFWNGTRTGNATLAPGLTEEGVVSAGALAAAHRSTLAGESYTWTVTIEERHGDRLLASRRSVVRVAGPATYVTEVERHGVFRSTVPSVAAETAYANGRTRFERVVVGGENGSDAVRRSAVQDADTFVGEAAALVSRYLSANESAVVGSERYEETLYGTTHVVVATGESYPGIRNATTRALVGADGTVWMLHRRHERIGADVTVEVRFTYTPSDRRTVERPDWVTDATVEGDPTRTENGTATDVDPETGAGPPA
jgi:hypothetical protein